MEECDGAKTREKLLWVQVSDELDPGVSTSETTTAHCAATHEVNKETDSLACTLPVEDHSWQTEREGFGLGSRGSTSAAREQYISAAAQVAGTVGAKESENSK